MIVCAHRTGVQQATDALRRIDNSSWQINGDYAPSRFEAQRDAVNTIFRAKTNSNPENVVGLMTMAGRRCVGTLDARS